ncbi:hypothetical protein ASE76_00085 [Xylophilus sp. Leaf220]|nr:hypothetical protein ASE76_00085 [Xylophilus sp. Leaf220]
MQFVQLSFFEIFLEYRCGRSRCFHASFGEDLDPQESIAAVVLRITATSHKLRRSSVLINLGGAGWLGCLSRT